MAAAAGGSGTGGTARDAFEELKAMAAKAVAAGAAPMALQLALPAIADPSADKRRLEVRGRERAGGQGPLGVVEC